VKFRPFFLLFVKATPSSYQRGGGKRLTVVMVTVGDGFAPLGPPMLPWEMHIKMGQQRTDFATSRPNWTREKSSKCLEL
jgi:hypothetical protein